MTLGEALHTASNGGRWFTVIFKKRTDGTIRKMNCRRGVTKHLKNFHRDKVDAQWRNEDTLCSDKGIVLVWDRGKQAYRSFPVDGVIQVSGAGFVFTVKDKQ